MDSSAEKDPLLSQSDWLTVSQEKLHTFYRRRWYLAFVFGSLGCLQSALCVVYLVVPASVEAAYGWSSADLSLMQIWIYVTFIVGIGPFAWLIQRKGMRMSTIAAALLLFLSTLCRIITSAPPEITWLAHVGHMLTGISAPVLFAGSPVISATWFPPDQRVTATAIIATYSLSGTALIFLVDPYVVPAPMLNVSASATLSEINVIENVVDIRAALMNLRYTEFSISTILLLLVLVYFPAKPPSAPSVSATMGKLAFIKGIRQLFSSTKVNFWCIAIPAAISSGLFGVFGSMLEVNLKEVGISQTAAGWLSFSGTVCSSITSIIVGRLGDRLIGWRRTILLSMISLGIVAALAFSLIVGRHIPFSIAGVYVSYLVLAIASYGGLPLFYETAIETTFPISEGITMGVITMAYNILPIAFLMVPLLPSAGTTWMNWFMFGSLVFCIPLLLLYKERYDRLSLDDSNVYS